MQFIDRLTSAGPLFYAATLPHRLVLVLLCTHCCCGISYQVLQLILVYTYRLRCSAWDVVASRCYGADLIVRLNSREGYGRTGAPRQRRGLLHPVCICEQHQQYSSSRYTWYVRVAHSSTCFHMLLVLFHFRNRRYPPSFYCCTISIQGCVVPRLYVQQHCATC